jgi:hypothetical protein
MLWTHLTQALGTKQMIERGFSKRRHDTETAR